MPETLWERQLREARERLEAQRFANWVPPGLRTGNTPATPTVPTPSTEGLQIPRGVMLLGSGPDPSQEELDGAIQASNAFASEIPPEEQEQLERAKQFGVESLQSGGPIRSFGRNKYGNYPGAFTDPRKGGIVTADRKATTSYEDSQNRELSDALRGEALARVREAPEERKRQGQKTEAETRRIEAETGFTNTRTKIAENPEYNVDIKARRAIAETKAMFGGRSLKEHVTQTEADAIQQARQDFDMLAPALKNQMLRDFAAKGIKDPEQAWAIAARKAAKTAESEYRQTMLELMLGRFDPNQ